jgi:2-iminobutanoate/2-iminopropanoate deaminase
MKLPATSCGVSKRNCAEANPPSLLELRRGSPRHSSLEQTQGILTKANKQRKWKRKGGIVMAEIKGITTTDAPGAVGPYSQGIYVDGLIFVSGQVPVDPTTGNKVEEDIKAQTDRVIENIKAVLKAKGADLSNVVRCDVFLKDMNDFKAMNEVYASKFTTNPKPARQAVQVGRLPLDAMIEISCIAKL